MEEEEKLTFVKYISESSKKIYELLANILTWSRAQTSKISFEPDVLDLNEIIEQTLELLKNNSVGKRIEIENSLTELVKVIADRNMVETILRNIISNAIKFTPIKGKIIIEALPVDSMMQISIKDTGVGMSQTDQKNLFEIDKTISRTDTSGESGTGLGLLICKESILKNGGKIWAESKPGLGSTIYFTLKSYMENIS